MAGDLELGARLRAARKRLGLTRDQVAKHIRCSPSLVSHMEAGRRTIYPHVPLAYEQAAQESNVNRRGVLSGLAASVIAPAAATKLIRHGFAAALGPRPGVDEWTQRLDTAGRDYMAKGAATVQRDLTGDLVVLQQNLDTPAMWGVASKLVTVWGKTTSGPDEATDWYRLAEVFARRSDDLDARVWVAGRAALALGYEGAKPPTALSFAREALELSDKPSAGRLNALMGAAHVYAQRGQSREARRTWDEVQRVYDALSPDESISDFNYPFWRLGVVGSLLFSRLGDARAEQWQAESDRYRPKSMVRFATHIELHRGLMLSRSGDYGAGVAYAEAALQRLPENKRSQSLVLMLDEIRRTDTSAAC